MESRVLYQDIKPYDIPTSLDALSGPGRGVLTLPLDVYWGPDSDADLDTVSGVTKAYQAILREGASEMQETLLNRDVLLRTWDELLLPVRVRSLWESRFPELTA
ncbi:transcriptional regulator [Curtobacterium sp. 18060]|uniref:transcriptional regulator n=1 Tax=Curtobacterium sp. 18060 TaxID=2681408 RepID=UPI0013597D92|nr:transcriptional regulator [Curtobacterium sp. 18060]